MKKYRVIVWGLGSVGRYAIKMIMQKESLQLVGAIDIDPEKVARMPGNCLALAKRV